MLLLAAHFIFAGEFIMTRVMIFIDFLNFNIEKNNYYKSKREPYPSLDYDKFCKNLCNLINNSRLVKVNLFIPKPDEFLMRDKQESSQYNWISSTLRRLKYFSIIEGRLIARKVNNSIEMDITNSDTFIKIEKGTDINMAVTMVSKAFHNAYDYAIVITGDTDYITALNQIENLGKNIFLVAIEGQNINKLKPYCDEYYFLTKEFFDNCLLYKSSCCLT